jgi:hypothetical protein
MVSNFQSIGGEQRKVNDRLFIAPPSDVSSKGTRPFIVIAGVYSAAKLYRKQLRDIYTRYKVNDPSNREQLAQMQTRLANVNVKATRIGLGQRSDQ